MRAPIIGNHRLSPLSSLGVLCVLVAVASAPSFVQESQKFRIREKDAFSAEQEKFDHPVPLNDAANAALASEPSIADLLKDKKLSAHDMPADWFTAAEVHLFIPAEKDLVVMGTGVARGANTSAFWILRQTKEGYRVVLTAQVHDLWLLSRRTNGLRDVETAVISLRDHTILSYTFDGKAYRVAKRTTSKNGEDP